MESTIELKTAHLIVPPEMVETVFGEEPVAFIAFKEETRSLLISPKSNSWFSKLHGSSEVLLKSKDLAGTKSIVIREILIDHEIDQTNRHLDVLINAEKRFLKIDF